MNDFAPDGSPPLRQRLGLLEAAYMRPYRTQIALALVAMLCQSLLLLPLPWLQGWVIDQLRANRPVAVSEILAAALLIPVMCLVGRAALGWFSSTQMSRISLELVRALTDSLHRKLQRLPLSYFDRHQTGDLMARLTNDVGTLLIFLSASSLQLVADLVLGLGIVVALFVLSWPLALAALFAIPFFFWNYRRMADRMRTFSQGVLHETANLYALLSERISAARTVRAFGTQERELAAFGEQLDRHSGQCRQSLRAAALQSFLAVLISGLATSALVILAAAMIYERAVSVGEAVAFVAYLGLLYQPVVRLTQFCGGVAATLAAVERITDVLAEPEPKPIAKRRWLPREPKTIELRRVSFRYREGGPLALDRINLRIEEGMTLGVCGPSGSGKSTLLALLPRLYELPPGGGRILIGDRDIRSIPAADLRRHVALVPQQARLFEGTLRFNLTYAAPKAGERLIRKALECVDLAELVESLPLGLDTPVGERGTSLSGGQRQRLALARTLLARPGVLLLDDCTSALDAQTEARVRERITQFESYQTRVLVSHRPESLAACDWVIALDQGRIVQQGPPWQVAPANPLLRAS